MSQIQDVAELREMFIAIAHKKYSLPRDQAEDLFHDTYLRGMEKYSLFQEGTDIVSWLCTIMHNILVNNTRKFNRYTKYSDAIIPTIDYSTRQDHNQFDLDKFIETLPKEFKDVFILRMSGYKHNEISKKLGIPIGTSLSRFHRITKRAEAFIH